MRAIYHFSCNFCSSQSRTCLICGYFWVELLGKNQCN
uniref:Uncharacterized protein n=1 Tax=Anguilla anguilla TaxID=7936 RepID=A0A0E9RW24_ANGAN